MIIYSAVKDDVYWWLDKISAALNVILKGNDEYAALGVSSTGGSFTLEETGFHIVLKLKAIYFGLQSLCGNVGDMHLKVLTDNTTAVESVNNVGSLKLRLG